MKVMVLGGTGLLGTELVRSLRMRNVAPISVARTGADVTADLTHTESVPGIIAKHRPDAIINAAAMVDFAACEADPYRAYLLHANLLEPLAEWSRTEEKPLMHVSTDQYFTDDGDQKHDEAAPVKLLNVYAASKHAGEAIALTSPHALVIRTNFTGMAKPAADGKEPFGRWAMQALADHAPLRLFDDYFCSTIDVETLARAICNLLGIRATGRINVASREVSSKAEFVHALAQAAGIPLDWAEAASVAGMMPPRATSNGLDVRKAESLLGYELPDLETVVQSLVRQWRET